LQAEGRRFEPCQLHCGFAFWIVRDPSKQNPMGTEAKVTNSHFGFAFGKAAFSRVFLAKNDFHCFLPGGLSFRKQIAILPLPKSGDGMDLSEEEPSSIAFELVSSSLSNMSETRP